MAKIAKKILELYKIEEYDDYTIIHSPQPISIPNDYTVSVTKEVTTLYTKNGVIMLWNKYPSTHVFINI